MLIAWNTATSGVGTLSWGTGPSALTNSLNEVAATQKHSLTISGLQPNTQYFYQVTTDAGYTSAVEHFWTAKPVENRAIKFLHYADCGYNNTIQNQLSALMEQEPGLCRRGEGTSIKASAMPATMSSLALQKRACRDWSLYCHRQTMISLPTGASIFLTASIGRRTMRSKASIIIASLGAMQSSSASTPTATTASVPISMTFFWTN
ncbi:MAG: fibronectin type III domain-containing protein [Bacteroidetes bacterium]|nr:fibronectin type III domain-containing protein [Bacteroidota bacterium]